MMLERHDLGSRDYEAHVMQRPYAQYSEPALEPPAGAEVRGDTAGRGGRARSIETWTHSGADPELRQRPLLVSDT